jgi:polyribonucleotide nucleotidyltransferase
MNEAISETRDSISKHAPTLLMTKISPDKIGTVIGQGGKVIQGLQKEYSVEIYIDEDGTVNIAGQNAEKARQAKEYIKLLTASPEIGKSYQGKVVKIADFGAFVEFMPGQQGLLHISQIDSSRVDKVGDFLKEGDIVQVKLLKIENGKFSLSRKALLENKTDKDKKEDSENQD